MASPYTVVGLYESDVACFATCVTADSPEAAIAQARLQVRTGTGGELLIAGVLAGDHQMIDGLTHGSDGPGYGVV